MILLVCFSGVGLVTLMGIYHRYRECRRRHLKIAKTYEELTL